MEKYIGKSVYKGTAIGPINVLKKSDGIVKRQHVEDVAAELQRLEDAKKQAQAQLGALYEKGASGGWRGERADLRGASDDARG